VETHVTIEWIENISISSDQEASWNESQATSTTIFNAQTIHSSEDSDVTLESDDSEVADDSEAAHSSKGADADDSEAVEGEDSTADEAEAAEAAEATDLSKEALSLSRSLAAGQPWTWTFDFHRGTQRRLRGSMDEVAGVG